jgi:hypothetical protein
MTVAEVCSDTGANSPASTPSLAVSTLPDDDPNTWYVAPGGNDGSDCRSWASACETISGAVGKIEPGDIVLIEDGTYVENLVLGDDLSIEAENPGMVVIDGGVAGSTVQIGAGANVTLRGVEIRNGSATDGGGIYCQGTLLTLDRCTVTASSALVSGGGIYVSNGELLVQSSTIEDNTASSGGGIYIDGAGSASAQVRSSTIAGNSADTGGGIEVGLANVVLESCTLTGNSASVGGSSLYAQSPAVVQTHGTIFGGSCAGELPASQGYNLELGSSCGLSGTGDLSGTDPELEPLADYGGPTRTAPPTADSPAVDTGDPAACETEDQRGRPRPMDGDGVDGARCDIGAVEIVFLPVFADGFESGDTSAWSATVH